MIKKSNRIVLSVLSLVGLFNIMFIPFSGPGLFSEDFEPQFFSVIENFVDALEFSESILFAIYYLLPVFIAFSCIFMLVAGLVGKKGLTIAAGVVGIVLWFVPFVLTYASVSDYIIYFSDFIKSMFDFEYGMMAIGTWIALIIFIAYFIAAVFSPKTANPIAYQPQPQYTYQNNYQDVAPVPADANGETENPTKFCPQCGTQLNADAKFCGSCGQQF